MSQPNTTRHHADWLSLVEVSGPFVSLPVIQRVFPQGLDPRDPAQAKALRAAYDEWQDNPTAPGKQHTWVMHVLKNLLGYPPGLLAEDQRIPAGTETNMPEMSETLRPDFALLVPGGGDTTGPAQLLIASYPDSQSLDKPVVGKHWKATPATRMMELLHGSGVSLGLVTNGEHWMMVYAPRGETTGYASWYGALWMDEPITLRAFHSLLGVHRFFGVAENNTLLALLKESASDQQEVTDQLGYQVREAVEVLVQSFDALDKESNRTLLIGVIPSDQYDAALTVMMRLVFLFSAEERGMLHLGKPLYDDNYAVSTLQEQLQEVADQYGEEVLERRYDAWARLLATFRAIHGGIQHQDLMMQAYGGSLFNPDRYPFLEGRPAGSTWSNTSAQTLEVNNRVVLHLLNSLQRLRSKTGGVAETRRVSFRALGVEQIGHVYEGLLDHTAVLANEPVIGIKGTRKKEPEIPLATLESLLAQGQDKLFDYLKEETNKSVSALRNAFDGGSLLDEHKLLIACEHDESLLARLRPFAGIIREDSFDLPLVVVPGSVYVTAGTTRRSTGTHYTPPSLTEPIVQYTMEPLVYEGPAEGWPREQWKLRSPKEILDLRICDMAMGSGAFLVQVCRYLAERLVEAWENEEKKHPGEMLITPEGQFSAGAPSERLVPVDENERIAIARRVVADRCLYGVDINSMAVEMAKLSLWLITMDANRPFTFLDHAFKCGDSLLGITSLEQLENFSLRPGGGKQQAFATLNLRRHIDDAKNKREELEAMPSDTPEQVTAKMVLYAEAEESVAKLYASADALVAVELKGLKGKTYEAERESSVDHMMAYWANGAEELLGYARQRLVGRHCLHWILTFPEIMDRGGFNAFVGNPPFMGGTVASSAFGAEYMGLLSGINAPWHGKADLAGLFLRRAALLLNNSGYIGFVTTASLIRGETAESAIAPLLLEGRIFRANSPYEWPGVAAVTAINLWIAKRSNQLSAMLDGMEVEGIDLHLDICSPQTMGALKPLHGGITSLLGAKLAPKNILINTEILNSAGDARKAKFRSALGADELYNLVTYSMAKAVILPELVDDDDIQWLSSVSGRNVLNDEIPFSAPSKQLRELQDSLEFIFATGEVIYKQLIICQIFPRLHLLKHTAIGFVSRSWGDFALLQSSFHEEWTRTHGLRLRSFIRYSPKRCADTFPMPSNRHSLERIGERLFRYRASLNEERNEGLTQIYNRYHDVSEVRPDISDLRRLHVEMDQAVAAAYGWQDIDLDHGFHETKQGIRYTISDAARREVLDRLLALNHQRYAEEEAEKAAHTLATPIKRTSKKAAVNPTPGLFD